METEKARAFQRGLRRRGCYRSLVWSYRGALAAILAGVPLLEHATGAAHDWAVLGFVVVFLTAWGTALASMFLLLRAVPVLRGPSPYIPAFMRALLSDLVLLERRLSDSARRRR
ncbi:hypothetical protein [Phytomonospora endophytica]|uniref:Uncharacterized protein n=1 Tax=Phytomonospora endophytica TaxID=714109 RepID=A0A841FYS4_9ACTN|nr:hypothetical protein [Phytomonospora endophytica]MBB6037589.1 hypothetical protein [Phytomonospora endophytica]GIG67885.1 hypothetical protein Pen01_41800 [Phytomonospora endophytica]